MPKRHPLCFAVGSASKLIFLPSLNVGDMAFVEVNIQEPVWILSDSHCRGRIDRRATIVWQTYYAPIHQGQIDMSYVVSTFSLL